MTTSGSRASKARPVVSICTVTWQSEADLEDYFAALDALEGEELCYRVVVVDCASDDDSHRRTIELGARCRWPTLARRLEANRGFAGGMNAALREVAADCEFVLALNPDARPRPAAIAALVRRHRRHHGAELRVAAVTGRLVRLAGSAEEGARETAEESAGRRLDACGMRLRPSWRHLDRGSDELDRGQYRVAEEVFGGTGAATLYLRAALEDVALDEGAFDEDFHSFREDAELCMRFQERGWRVLYEPAAEIVHRRLNLPRRRSEMSEQVNCHSLKNRYLLRVLHQTGRNALLTAPFALSRDLGILLWVLSRERSSLGAYRWLWRHRRRLFARRSRLRARVVAPGALDRWFWVDRRPLPASAEGAGSAR